MKKNTKYIVIPFGYEYNDNTYDRDGLQFDNAKHFDTIEEAKEARKTMTFDRLPELEDSYRGVLMCIPWEARKKIFSDLDNSEWDYETELDFDAMTEKERDKTLDNLGPYVFEICEVDTSKDSTKIEYEPDEYSTQEFHVKLNEDNSVVLHSLEGPADCRIWNDSTWADDEEDKKYYIDGEQVDSKEVWRNIKSGKIIDK